MINRLTHNLILLFAFCFISSSLSAQSTKVDVEIHVGGNANIYLDGSQTSSGKGSISVKLSLGKHTAVAKLPNCEPTKKTFTITSSYASRIVKLDTPKPIKPTSANVTFIVENNALIFIDDTIKPKAVGSVTCNLPFGEHKVYTKLASHETKVKMVNVTEECNNTTIMLETPTKQHGELKISTSPIDAFIYVDDKLQPTKSPTTIPIDAGVHRIKIVKGGYKMDEIDLLVEPNKTTLLDRELEEIKLQANTSTNANNSEYRYTRKDEFYEANGKKQIMYFGFGAGILTNLDFEISAFDIRFGVIELRPFVWGGNYAMMNNFANHRKLQTLYNPVPVGTSYFGDDEYEIAKPERVMQWYYAPMVRFFIPLNAGCAITLGVGPQFSWTKVTWEKSVEEYGWDFKYYEPSYLLPNTGLQFDGMWFTSEISILFASPTFDINAFLRYQDGFYIGTNLRFGKRY